MTLFETAARPSAAKWQPVYFAGWLFCTLVGLCLHPDPSGHGTHQELGLPPCPSALILDRPCPGCGLTTSWTALLHGDWQFAFHAHPLGPALYLGFTVSAFLALYGFFHGKVLVLDSVPASRFLSACAVIFFVFGMYRMATTPHFRTARESEMASAKGW